MNITKLIATEVAEKLTDKKRLEIVNLKTDLSLVFEGIVLKSIPDEVIKLYKKYPNHFETKRSFQLCGNGFEYQYLGVTKDIPHYKSSFTPNEEDSKLLINKLNEIKDLKKKYDELFKEIEITLFSLRTYKRVEENFPEAFLLLPNKTTYAVALNISDLRQKIK